jgi:signal transduction histidine kinase
VVVGYRDHEVTVEVIDDGRGAVTWASDGRVGAGHGLIGMRERVQVFGGDLQTGPRPGGGFRVAARLPLAADQR